MNLKELTSLLVTKIVTNTEAVSVVESVEEDVINIDINVDDGDLGRVIGRDGKIINAIRTIVQASGYVNVHKNVRININKENN